MRRTSSLAGWIALVLALFVSRALSASSAPPAPTVTARCQPTLTPGRVLCEVEAEVSAGRLSWADAVVVSSPDFARPLRGRVGPSEATARTPRRVRLPIALVATGEGTGELRLRSRVISCTDDARCAPFQRSVSASVRVGQAGQAAPGAGGEDHAD
ncbi:MAG: hypothetical protein KIT72_14495 [Polyangiaceae bacterium]|nr:hypothetical protein [Polyangiaceae bacterium]MCW5791623.1 hypothetical protein [Polyangiaceae bacterium]